MPENEHPDMGVGHQRREQLLAGRLWQILGGNYGKERKSEVGGKCVLGCPDNNPTFFAAEWLLHENPKEPVSLIHAQPVQG